MGAIAYFTRKTPGRSNMSGKYHTVVIDPPWDIKPSGKWRAVNNGLRAGLPYHTMTDKEIKSFDIDKFAAPGCKLFLWCTNGKLPLAFDILKSWGFRYHATMAWVKKNGPAILGIHYNVEYCLMAYRGGYGFPSITRAIHTAYYGKHSEKPPAFYQAILTKTKPPRIDLFGRKRHYGFDSWGDQVETKQPTLD